MKAPTIFSAFARAFARQAEDLGRPIVEGWPSADYRANPVGFCREVLGTEPWSKQIQILEAIRDHKRVAVGSGNKIGKSLIIATAVLWWWASWPDAIVIMTAPTSRQVDRVVWKEVRRLHARSKRPLPPDDPALILNPALTTRPLDGEPHILARTGLTSGFREITGFTAKDADDVSGFSGAHLLIVADEASGIEDEIFEAFEGVRGGGGRIVLISNPTRAEGEFFNAFGSKAKSEANPTGYHAFRVASTETPNATTGREIIPGLATREYCEERLREWGDRSPLYRIRVLGEFCEHESGRIMSVHMLTQATERWAETEGVGRLIVGLDPAGPGLAGDLTCWAARRGNKIFQLVDRRDLTADAIVALTNGLLEQWRNPNEMPVVVLDCEGEVGSKVQSALRRQTEEHNNFRLISIKSSNAAVRRPDLYPRLRDELWANCARWLDEEQGAIPPDTKLEKELHSAEWVPQLKGGQVKATAKDKLRKALGRSPDRADACMLAVWPSAEARTEDDVSETRKPAIMDARAETIIDPYAGEDAWR